jgi:negative regulator of flagellin synthesis FlgM
MRIDAYMQVNQLYNANKTKSKAKTDYESSRDSLEISDFGSAYQVAKQAVEQGTSVREERVKEIQSQIAAGTYNVSLEDVADKLADQLLA